MTNTIYVRPIYVDESSVEGSEYGDADVVVSTETIIPMEAKFAAIRMNCFGFTNSATAVSEEEKADVQNPFFTSDHNEPMSSWMVSVWYRASELLSDDYDVGVEHRSTDCILAELFAGQPIMPGYTKAFTYRELSASTQNFRQECHLGEGPFGRVYKGRLESTGQIVAVKQHERNGFQGDKEFLVEFLFLSLLHHSYIVKLVGYCADGDQRLLVFDFMPMGSLKDHLHDLPPEKEPLDWNTRMKIAVGVAKGLEFLHDKAHRPVIHRDLKTSSILLDFFHNPKLSNFGLATLGPVGDETYICTEVMGTYGYCDPEYVATGQLSLKSDIYSFGVVLLELITGRKAIDRSRTPREWSLVEWAAPFFKNRRKFPKLADPLLQGRYPMRAFYKAVSVAAMCLQQQAANRPAIEDVVTALSYLAP